MALSFQVLSLDDDVEVDHEFFTTDACRKRWALLDYEEMEVLCPSPFAQHLDGTLTQNHAANSADRISRASSQSLAGLPPFLPTLLPVMQAKP